MFSNLQDISIMFTLCQMYTNRAEICCILDRVLLDFLLEFKDFVRIWFEVEGEKCVCKQEGANARRFTDDLVLGVGCSLVVGHIILKTF